VGQWLAANDLVADTGSFVRTDPQLSPPGQLTTAMVSLWNASSKVLISSHS
jgi:hypothetical protein